MQAMCRSINARASLISYSILALSLCVPCAAVTNQNNVPPSTTFPVRFIHSVDAKKARPGDRVIAKTMQVVNLPNGQQLPKGSLVLGHVVEVRPLPSRESQNEQPKRSSISIHFDQILSGAKTLPVNLSVRALANAPQSEIHYQWLPHRSRSKNFAQSIASYEATYPHALDETDRPGNMVLISGDEFSPLDKTIRDIDGEVIGYNREQGVFAKLPEAVDIATDMRLECAGTDSEQSLAIVSPSVCGTYGLGNVSMLHTGRSGSGTFTLESPDHSVKLYAGSAALLQETQVH
jgi:hypothetical protein